MTSTPIYKDHTGRWRQKNPYSKNDVIYVPARNSSRHDCFELDIQYHEFPNCPDTKPGEVVMAYLQWQFLAPNSLYPTWQNVEDSENDWRVDYCRRNGCHVRQIWVLADKQEAKEEHKGFYITSDKGVTAHVNMSPNADKETVDAVKKMIDLAYKITSKGDQEAKEEQAKESERFPYSKLALVEAKKLIESLLSDELELTEWWQRHIAKKCAELIRCGCQCDDYNGFDCGCSRRLTIHEEALNELKNIQP